MPKHLIATYKCSSGWLIPDSVPFIEDGGDGKKVGSWYIRWDKLHIIVEKDGKKVWRVIARMWNATDYDFKRPDDTDVEETTDTYDDEEKDVFEEDEDSEVE